MRWDKALNGLIAVLLLLNIGFLYLVYQKEVGSYGLSEKRVHAITTLLREHGIGLSSDLPQAFTPKPTIWVLPREFSADERDALVENVLGTKNITITREKSAHTYEQESRIYKGNEKYLIFKGSTIFFENQELNTQISASTPVEVDKQILLKKAEDFVTKVDLYKSFENAKIEYVEKPYGAKITYYSLYKGNPIFDSYIELEVKEEGVFFACIHELGVTEEEGNKNRIYPIDEVLMGLLDVLSEKEANQITHIELGYAMKEEWGLHVLKEEAIPVYKILLEGLEEPVFVNAYTNKRLLLKN